MLTAAVGLAICFTLFGCDQSPQQAQTATPTPVAVAPPAPCNCRQGAVAPTIKMARYHIYRHRYGHRDHYGHHGHTLSEFLAYSTSTSSSTASEAPSVREYRLGDEARYAQPEHSEMRTGSSRYQQGGNDETWVDGFGRAHYADFGPLGDEHPGLISGNDEHERMRPWRGYNSDCKNRIN
jgi:hypothetical protein